LIDNRIVNGGFETGMISPFTGNRIAIESSSSHSGPFSARLVGGTSTSFLSQLVPVSPGENFEFFVSLAKLGTNTSASISIVISYLDSRSNILATPLMINIPSGRLTNDWIEIYRTTTLAPDSTTHARVVITKNSASFNSASVLVDDVALLAVSASVSGGDLTVGGNATVHGNLMVEGTTQLGNESFRDTVKVVGNLETLSNTSFFGPNNVFTGSIFLSNNLEVGSEIIGSGKITAFTLDLFGSESTTDTLVVRYGDLIVSGSGFGVVLRAPNESLWRLTVDNSGNLRTEPFN